MRRATKISTGSTAEVVELEKHPSDQEILASIFRTIHTIKGTSGFLGFGKLEAVTHVGESLLARLRDGQLSLNPERTTALLAMIDVVRQMLAEIQATGADGNGDHSELSGESDAFQQPSPGGMPRRRRLAAETEFMSRVSSLPEQASTVVHEAGEANDNTQGKRKRPPKPPCKIAGKAGQGSAEKEAAEVANASPARPTPSAWTWDCSTS